ncbi:Eco57I restriction-modification methylase domain-containing protein [Fibrivirga algicola]|jgi:N12 class adenine-specific DNA methylase|uniref:Methyltransferase type 11 n=1 Tax=Fibrivirga algicola TaxID=2950420 RepID=A0ABX0QMB7_9BACT|nr:DEAD/DEAH box helicase family protein [Fibrivirga algicola]NID13646.1 methyltransferase type 11 [Fibrivirga algicola]
MTRYPTPRTRSAQARPVVIVANQYTLFGQPVLVPPTRGERKPCEARPSVARPEAATLLTLDERIELRPTSEPCAFSLCPHDFTLPTGNAAKLRANVAAIETLKRIEQEQRPATIEEQRLLSLYTGWGGLSQVWKNDVYERWQRAQADPTQAVDDSINRWGSQYGRTRQRLADLLTPAEQSAAEASTLNAFYTAPHVVAAMWQAVEGFGFTGGRILEPAAGIGYFIGLMPPAIRERSAWVAVEKDRLSGQILQRLYPDVETHICGLEEAGLQAGSRSAVRFDLVIGNVPFGSYTVYDRHYPELNSFAIHNYFIGRAAQLVKPGGIVALITSMGTFDAAGSEFRRFLTVEADAELLGAIRLPSNAFEANAGTQVTTDVLFLRKRTPTARPFAAHPFERTVTLRASLQAEATDEETVRTLAVNEYYHAYPTMMLGDMHFADEVNKGGLYRADQPTLHLSDPTTLPQRLAAALDQLPRGIYNTESAARNKEPAKADQRFTESVTIRGKRYSQTLITAQYERVKRAFNQLRKAEQAGRGEVETDGLRVELNQAYALFTRYFGTLNRNRALSFLEEYDPQFASVQALEVVNRDEPDRNSGVPPSPKAATSYTVAKADIFRQRVYPATHTPERVESLPDALRLSIALYGWVNAGQIGVWMNQPAPDVKQALLGAELAYLNPTSARLEDRDTYLSGNVRKKLAAASEAAKSDAQYAVNERALAAVVPATIPAPLISFRLGSVWIPTHIIEQFISQTLQTSCVTVRYNHRVGQYEIDGMSNVSSVQNRSLGTSRRKAIQLIEAALQQRTVVVTKTIIDPEGKEKTVKDVEATSQAVQAQEALNDLFIDFVRDHHRTTIEPVYNELYNSYVHKTYREPALKQYPGASPDVQLRLHQFRGVERIKEQDTLLAHAVGSGKTFTMITAAMELKRLGLAHKPMIVVQNSTLNDFARAWRRLYPAALIYVPQPADLEAANRRRFLQRIATNNFDGVLIPQSFLKLIPDDPASEEAFIQEEIERVAYTIAAAKRQGREKPMSVKRLNELKLRLANRRIRQADRKKDDMLTFDQLGIDALFLDESHRYKRLGFFTARQNVKGIDSAGSEDALSALFKCRTVQARRGRVVLATGTPISNTMAESWTTLRFIAPDRLNKAMLSTFDQFAGAFGSVIQSFELTATGNFKAVERFAKFVNVQQLSELYRAYVDVVLNEDVIEFQRDATLPTLKDGQHTRIILPQTEGVADELNSIKATLRWFENLTGAEKRDNSHVPLVCFGQARKATIDLRLLDAANPDEADSKCNRVVTEILRLYRQSATYRGTQLVFADTYQSPAVRGWFDEEGEERKGPRFNLFDDIRAKLIEQGVPADEIAIVPAEPDKREPLFAKVRTGKVRVLLGTSERAGVGVNVQERLVAVHHLDAPNRPTDFEQRNGRLIRQGNLHAAWGIPVEVLTYGVERTLDATAYGRLAIKQKFINQVLKGHIADDQMADISADDDFAAMSFDQMMATLSGSQYALLYTTRQLELSRVQQARKNWQRGLMDAQWQVENAQRFIQKHRPLLIELEEEAVILQQHFGTPYATKSVTVNGTSYSEKWGEAVQHLIEQVKGLAKRRVDESRTLIVNGLTLILTGERSQELIGDFMPGQAVVRYRWGRSLSGVVGSSNGLFSSLKAAVARVCEGPAQLTHELNRAGLTEQEFSRTQSQPFRQEAELLRLETEVADLKRRMETEGEPEPVAEVAA